MVAAQRPLLSYRGLDGVPILLAGLGCESRTRHACQHSCRREKLYGAQRGGDSCRGSRVGCDSEIFSSRSAITPETAHRAVATARPRSEKAPCSHRPVCGTQDPYGAQRRDYSKRKRPVQFLRQGVLKLSYEAFRPREFTACSAATSCSLWPK